MNKRPLPETQGTLTTLDTSDPAKWSRRMWLLQCTCGAVVKTSQRKFQEGRARCPACYPSIAERRYGEILALLPRSVNDLTDVMDLSRTGIRHHVNSMLSMRMIHVGAWKRTQGEGGSYQPVYHVGEGVNVACKLTPNTPAERSKKYLKNLKKRDGQEEYERQKAARRALYHAKKAAKKGDPLVNAFFGRAL